MRPDHSNSQTGCCDIHPHIYPYTNRKEQRILARVRCEPGGQMDLKPSPPPPHISSSLLLSPSLSLCKIHFWDVQLRGAWTAEWLSDARPRWQSLIPAASTQRGKITVFPIGQSALWGFSPLKCKCGTFWLKAKIAFSCSWVSPWRASEICEGRCYGQPTGQPVTCWACCPSSFFGNDFCIFLQSIIKIHLQKVPWVLWHRSTEALCLFFLAEQSVAAITSVESLSISPASILSLCFCVFHEHGMNQNQKTE